MNVLRTAFPHTPPPLMAVLVIVAAITLFSVPVTGMNVPVSGTQRPSVVTCTIQQESATSNNRAEVVYYECIAVNGAIVPSVTFILHGESTGDLWLRDLVGHTVDVRLDVVR